MSVAAWLAAAVVLPALAGATLLVGGRARWRRRTAALESRLRATRVAPSPTRYRERELQGLPEPVQRYFRAVLPDGAPIVSAVTMRQAGTFDTGATSARWKPFTSRQVVVTRRPGFVWDARIRMLPGLAVHVHDAVLAGEGVLHAALLGLFSVADLRGAGELARGELMRFLAEAAWYPTALLPSQGVRWEAVDEQSARATLADGSETLALTFRFDADGLIAAVRADARGRMVGARVVPTPWVGRWSAYQRRHGMRIPTRGEVAWLLPDGEKPYWRGRLTASRYEFAP